MQEEKEKVKKVELDQLLKKKIGEVELEAQYDMGELLLLPTYIPYLHTFSPAASTQNSAETHTRMAGGGTWDHFYGPSIVTWQGLRVLMPGYFVQHSFFFVLWFLRQQQRQL